MQSIDTTKSRRQAPSPGPSPSETGRDAAASIVLPVLESWNAQRKFLRQVSVGITVELLRRFAAEVTR